MPDKLREKYYDAYYAYKVKQYKSEHHEAANMDDMQVWVSLGVHFSGNDASYWLADFLAFCVHQELQEKLRKVQTEIVKGFREINGADAEKFTDEQIAAKLPVPPIEAELLEHEIKEKFIYLIEKEIEILNKENNDNIDMQDQTKKGSMPFSTLNSDISDTNHNILERKIALSILQDSVSKGIKL